MPTPKPTPRDIGTSYAIGFLVTGGIAFLVTLPLLLAISTR